MSAIRDYLIKLENNLMVGSGRWIADFTESFWDFRVGDTSFDMVILGNTRPRGFLLSRFFAWLTLPAYLVGCFVHSGDTQLKNLGTLTRSIKRYMEEQEMTWSWLVLTGEGSFTRKAKAGVQKNNSHEIGIALVDLTAQEVITNDSVIGRRMRRFVRTFK
jgi:hypothetical protein